MSRTDIVIYQARPGSVPLVDWLRRQPERVQDKCLATVELLADRGNELRRPYADYLDSGVYELRVIVGRVHYRILYCFVGKCVVLLTHGLVKTDAVPPKEIAKALEYKRNFAEDPSAHSFDLKDMP